MASASSPAGEDVNAPNNQPSNPGFLKRLWVKLELDLPTVLTLAKGGLPPAIALAMLQAKDVANTFTTIGYLVAIASILGMAIMPRAKFIQTMVISVFFLCIGTCLVLLMVYSAIKAREHTAPPAGSANALDVYNSSASAVCGIWLFFMTWIINAVRASRPQYTLPLIIISIFVDVASSYATRFTTMATGIAFARRLMEAFLTGFAIATAVSLFIFPVTMRHVVFKEMTGYIGLVQMSLRSYLDYFTSLEGEDMFLALDQDGKPYTKRGGKHGTKPRLHNPQAEKIQALATKLVELHGKLQGDITFAKREIAYGHLGPTDLSEIFKQLRAVMLPVVGLTSITDIFSRLADSEAWNHNLELENQKPISEDERRRIIREWNEIMKAVHASFEDIITTMDDGLRHVLYTLEFVKRPKGHQGDLENNGIPQPGDKSYAVHFRRRKEVFHKGKELALRAWCEEKGISLPSDFFERPRSGSFEGFQQMHRLQREDTRRYKRNQRQVYLLLYMEYLLHSTSCAIYDLIKLADSKADAGTFDRKRFILPGYKRTKKWFLSIFQKEDRSDGSLDETGSRSQVHLGEAYNERKDPEHLPPTTPMERLGNQLRIIPRFLRSPESAFGFRVACATMTIAIVGFLHDTQVFFMKQRFVWAMIMITISMSPTLGQSIFNFLLRILGSAVAMAACFPIYYIPDGKSPGVIVFLWLFVSIGLYLPVKKPQFTVLGVISVVTTTMIIGYTLEVRTLGRAVAESNGQPAYPIYLLAPYRLATVVVGLTVAFIWTFFPFPMSEHSALRQNLGASMYLLANYYSIQHETVQARIRGDEGDMACKDSPGRKMEKVRNAVFGKQMLLLGQLRMLSAFTKWEVPIGGRFPKEHYDCIIESVQNIHNYISLVGYASATYTKAAEDNLRDSVQDESGKKWLSDFRRLIERSKITSHEITSLLSLLSSSISNGVPLPPYLTLPQPYRLSQRLESMDKDILSLRHINEPGYAAFAVIQISTRCIIGDLDRLVQNVKALVGELDFSFHIVSTKDERPESQDTLVDEKGDKAD